MTPTTRYHNTTAMDETAEWCNSFVLVPKSTGKVRLCLDPAMLNQAHKATAQRIYT